MTKLLATALAIEAAVVATLLTVTLDMYAHQRVQALGGVNIWGYRGPVMQARRPNEIRIAVVGGDLAFGWGVAASETLAPTIRQLVALQTDRPGAALRPVTAVNLGAMGLPPSGYAARLEHYSYLRPDVVCIIADADRAMWGRSWLPDVRSAVWQHTGYAPMLPLVLEEKGWRRTAAALRRADAALARAEPAADEEEYAGALAAAASRALDLDAAVLLVLPPRISGYNDTDRAAVARVVEQRFATEPRFRLLDLALDLEIGNDLLLDGVNLSTGGHLEVATHLAPAVVDLVVRRPSL